MHLFIDAITEWGQTFLGPAAGFFLKILLLFITTGLGLGMLGILVWAAWVAISDGLYQEQRARFFVRLLQTGLRQGQSIEQTVRTLAESRARELGVYFHLVAAWMERGHRLGPALDEVPRFLPRSVAAMLQVGETIANMPAALKNCEASLRTGISQAQTRSNDLMVLFFVSPIGPILIWILSIFVMPKMEMIAADMEVAPPAMAIATGFQWSFWLGTFIAAIWVVLWLLESSRGGGQWIFRTLVPGGNSFVQEIDARIPWKHRRLLRVFSGMLSDLLDAGVPESKAVELAAESTGNRVFLARSRRVIQLLSEGQPLAEALAPIDTRGELRWRIRNAARGGLTFRVAVRGWNETLEAKASQQEQLFSQVVTTGFVLLNGLMVGIAAVTVFQFLTAIIAAAGS